MNKCEYCDEEVEYPYPIHPKCAEIWLKGYHARMEQELQTTVAQTCEIQNNTVTPELGSKDVV